ncbi:hypothetical protein NPIL_673151 [Nephila pilipes]|uniref:Uncharacterized protein n=1 Tax=Nephila pilipes TaxID=299642 RepID=A0A8X6PR21_NEPPI|nr:hypothetical protein NPIL_673151 [Nephila pilipes]
MSIEIRRMTRLQKSETWNWKSRIRRFVANYRKKKEEKRKRAAIETKEKAESENTDIKIQPLRLTNICRHFRRTITHRLKSNHTDQECLDNNKRLEVRTSQRRAEELADRLKERLEVFLNSRCERKAKQHIHLNNANKKYINGEDEWRCNI